MLSKCSFLICFEFQLLFITDRNLKNSLVKIELFKLALILEKKVNFVAVTHDGHRNSSKKNHLNIKNIKEQLLLYQLHQHFTSAFFVRKRVFDAKILYESDARSFVIFGDWRQGLTTPIHT